MLRRKFGRVSLGYRRTHHKSNGEIPSWHSRLRIQCCHYSGTGWIPGLGTCPCYLCGQKRKKKEKKKVTKMRTLKLKTSIHQKELKREFPLWNSRNKSD